MIQSMCNDNKKEVNKDCAYCKNSEWIQEGDEGYAYDYLVCNAIHGKDLPGWIESASLYISNDGGIEIKDQTKSAEGCDMFQFDEYKYKYINPEPPDEDNTIGLEYKICHDASTYVDNEIDNDQCTLLCEHVRNGGDWENCPLGNIYKEEE